MYLGISILYVDKVTTEVIVSLVSLIAGRRQVSYQVPALEAGKLV